MEWRRVIRDAGPAPEARQGGDGRRGAELRRPPAGERRRSWWSPSAASTQDALAEVYRRHAGGAFGLACRHRRATGRSPRRSCRRCSSGSGTSPSASTRARGSLRSFLLAQTHGRASTCSGPRRRARGREEREALAAALRPATTSNARSGTSPWPSTSARRSRSSATTSAARSSSRTSAGTPTARSRRCSTSRKEP